MATTPRAFWVTVETAPGRTADHRIKAATAWSAGWLFRQLYPGSTVRFVRPIPQRQEHSWPPPSALASRG